MPSLIELLKDLFAPKGDLKLFSVDMQERQERPELLSGIYFRHATKKKFEDSKLQGV